MSAPHAAGGGDLFQIAAESGHARAVDRHCQPAGQHHPVAAGNRRYRYVGGGREKRARHDYKEIRGYVLARKPAMLHMIGLLPIVRTTAFDMVSDGENFKLWIPPKNRFVIGRNDVRTHDTNQSMESIRPQEIYDALLIRPIDPANEIAILEKNAKILTD